MSAARTEEMDPERLDRLPLDELLRRLIDEVGLLVRQELALARAEMREKAAAATRGGAMVGAALVVGLMAAGAATAFLVAVLAIAIPVWAAALIVAMALGAAAWWTGTAGVRKARRAMPLVPSETAEKVKEDVTWVKQRTRSELR